MSIRLIHLADVHYCREFRDPALTSLRHALKTGIEQKIDLWALAGDLFERSVSNTEKDGFPELVEAITAMLDVAPMVAVQGTSTKHDLPGCYDVLERIRARCRFTLLQPGKPYTLLVGEDDHDKRYAEVHEIDKHVGDLLILGLPEPTKAQFLAGMNAIGKDEANAKIQEGLRNILLGYGGIRKNNPSIPCLMVYHGMVNGATASSGQVLTGDIGISRDDLALAGADYYALGHIHKAQQIPGLPAYYAGSAFPTDWGELEQKQFNVVSLNSEGRNFGDYKLDIEHIPFPHAPRKKITFPADDIDIDLDANEYVGFQTWLDIKGKSKDGFDCDVMLKCILKDGALHGSRVTFTPIPTETVRAIEIQGVTSLPEKITVWAKNSEIEVRESVLEKAALLEANARKSGILPQPHAWRLRKVRTRGLKGIWRGMGLDEYEIDFDRFDQGIIALVAENGTGKTTMMLNCHMYPSMLTLDKKLQDYFRLRESYRHVYVVDELTGTEYRARMLIDGKNASGKAEYYLDQKTGDEWQPITSGKTKDYEDKIVELFGSEGLYLRSAFIPSKPSPRYPDLSYVAQGEKKNIFNELIGKGHYKIYCEWSRSNAKEIRSSIETKEAQINAGADLPEKIKTLVETMNELERQAGNSVVNLDLCEKSGKMAKEEVDRFAVIVKTNGETQAKIDTLNSEKDKADRELATWYRKLQTAKAFSLPVGIESTTELDEQIKHHSELHAKKNELEAQKNEVDRHNLGMRKIENEVIQLNDKKEFVLNQIKDLEKCLQTKETCPKCGHQFAHHQERIEKNIADCSQKIFEIDKAIEEKRHQIQYVNWNSAQLEAVKKELAAIDINQLLKITGQAKTVERDKTEAENQIKTLSDKIETLTWEIDGLSQKLDATVDRLHSEAVEKYEVERKRYTYIKAEIATVDGKISAMETEIADKRKHLAELETLKAEVEKQKAELRDWDFLAEACGIDGIPALELDAVAPEISAAANTLLESAYGQRFQIEFRTTKIQGAGSKKKQVEDFTIWIRDAQDGWEQPYETLSGGEETWIKKAISDAFEIIKSKNTGVKMLTVFQDELDGKLSPHNRQVFFKLLEKTHEQTGRYHTVVVTHSEAVQEQIAQKIVMRKKVQDAV